MQYSRFQVPQQPGWGPQQPQWGPPQPGWGPPPPVRSGPEGTLGVLSVIFGSLISITSLWSLASAAMMDSTRASFGPLLSAIVPGATVPPEAYRTMALASGSIAGLMLLMSIALLATGIGLVGKRAWGRTVSKIWAWTAFPVLIVRMVIWHVAYAPAQALVLASMLPAGTPATPQVLGLDDVWCVLLCAYPIVLLALLRGRGLPAQPSAT